MIYDMLQHATGFVEYQLPLGVWTSICASGVLVGLMQRDAAVDKIVDMSTANMYVYATLANMGVDKTWNR